MLYLILVQHDFDLYSLQILICRDSHLGFYGLIPIVLHEHPQEKSHGFPTRGMSHSAFMGPIGYVQRHVSHGISAVGYTSPGVCTTGYVPR